jgi:hypothetical protein
VASSTASFANLASLFVENGDYTKIRNITLSYSLPVQWFNRRLRSASISFSAINPFNFVPSKYVDPELTGSGARATLPGTNTPSQQNVTVGAFVYGTFSAPRQYIGTLRLSF